MRSNKHERVVDKVELMHAAPIHAQIRFSTGRKATVSLRDIAFITERQFCLPENCSAFKESLSPNDKDDKCDYIIKISDPSFTLSPCKESLTAGDNLPIRSTTNQLISRPNDKGVSVRNDDNRLSADPV